MPLIVIVPWQVPSIVGLLAHENTDIAIAVVNLLHELCDEDVLDVCASVRACEHACV